MPNDLGRLRKSGEGRNVMQRRVLREADGIWEIEKALVDIFGRHVDNGCAPRVESERREGLRRDGEEDWLVDDNRTELKETP